MKVPPTVTQTRQVKERAYKKNLAEKTKALKVRHMKIVAAVRLATSRTPYRRLEPGRLEVVTSTLSFLADKKETPRRAQGGSRAGSQGPGRV